MNPCNICSEKQKYIGMKIKPGFKLLFVFTNAITPKSPSSTAELSQVLLEDHDSRGDSCVFKEI